jgi:hypothetical protein
LRVSTDVSTPAGWNTAVRVFSVGAVRPKPIPRHAVAARSSPYAIGSPATNWLTMSSAIETRLANRPTR